MKDNLSSGCTTQQAFYKLRLAITEVTGITTITPQTLLTDIIPLKNRRQTVNNFEKILGFGINILTPKDWIVYTLTVLFLGSLITFFFSWKIALLGLIASIAGFKIAFYYGRELSAQTVGEVAKNIKNIHYSKVRSLTGSVNKTEVEQVLLELFLDTVAYTEEKLADFAI